MIYIKIAIFVHIRQSSKACFKRIFVVEAITGQEAANTARVFNQRLDFDGVVLTKMDSDTWGGAITSL